MASNSLTASWLFPRFTLSVLKPTFLAPLRFSPISSRKTISEAAIPSIPFLLATASISLIASSYTLGSGFLRPVCAEETNTSNCDTIFELSVLYSCPSGKATVFDRAATTNWPDSLSFFSAGKIYGSGVRDMRIISQNSRSPSTKGIGGIGDESVALLLLLPDFCFRLSFKYSWNFSQSTGFRRSFVKPEKNLASRLISPRSSLCQLPLGAVRDMLKFTHPGVILCEIS